jgi:hypothetical protein
MAAVGGKKVPIDAPPATASIEPFVGPTSGVRVRF